MSRKEDRKAARVAKKQRRVEHFQRYRENLKMQRAGQVKGTLIDKKEKVNKYTPPKKTEISDEEIPSDEEILSDEMISDVEMEKKENKEKKIKKEKKLKKEKKAKKEKKQSFDEGFDFMSMIDEAFDSGKLTKEGFADSEESDFDFNESDSEEEDYESEEDEYESLLSTASSSESEADKPEEKPVQKVQAWKPKSVPALSGEMTDEAARLLKQIQSAINKLSISNLSSITNEIMQLFQNNRRKQVIEMIVDTLLGQLTRPGGNILDAFALNFAALSTLLYYGVGVEFAAHLIERLVLVIDEHIQSAVKESSANGGTLESHAERSLINCINLAAFLHCLDLISHKLICDLLAESAERLSEIDVEIILKIMRSCGPLLRRSSPEFLKSLSLSLGSKTSNSSSRFKFMVEQIGDLTTKKGASLVEFESARKAIRAHCKLNPLLPVHDALQISLSDIRDISTRGKWWLVGASYKGPAQALPQKANEIDPMAELAKKHHMNTDVRKAVFAALTTAEDVNEAVAGILGLRLNGRQEREIIAVVLHCAGQERKYNPFYGRVLLKLINHSRGFPMTLQFALWDSLKAVREGTWPLRKLANIARLFGFLIGQRALELASLRKAQFVGADAMQIVFYQLLLQEAMQDGDHLVQLGQKLLKIVEGSSADASSSGKRKVTLLSTGDVDLDAFEDEFFNTGSSAEVSKTSQEKRAECKALRDGLMYFLEGFCLNKDAELPFTQGIEEFKKNCLVLKDALIG